MEAIRSQDVVVAAGLYGFGEQPGAKAALSRLLGMPRPRVSESVRRLAGNGVYSKSLGSLRRARLLDLLVHGVPWLFPAEPGSVGRGLPTSHSGPGLEGLIAADQHYVWPSEHGRVEGRLVSPIHPSAVTLSLESASAYRLLSLVDAIRVGRVREQLLAKDALTAMMRP